MKQLTIVLTLFFAFGLTYSGTAQTSDYYDSSYEVDSGTSYDWESGNTYNWSTDASGTTTVDGYNYRTGSTWETTIESDGDMSGYDSDYNYWEYDRSTGSYYNYGTGESRSTYDSYGSSYDTVYDY